MVTLKEIKSALESFDSNEGEASAAYIDEAIHCLQTAAEALNSIPVMGRVNVDKLLGCMLGIDLIIGEDNNA